MSEPAGWAAVEQQLERFAAAGRRARLWLRDDDAVAPSPALERLLALCARHEVPVLLAVIPAGATPALASRLAAAPLAIPCQHGFAHANHAPQAEKKREYGPDRPLATMRAELEAGRDRLHALFGGSVAPIFVPPWNRIDAQVARLLPGLGFRALSVFGGKPAAIPGLCRLDCRLDIMDWHGGRIGRDHGALAQELAGHLAQAFERDEPVGVLGHHLVHDETAWGFLEALLALGARHPGACWISVPEWIGA
jgi:hypothetical protein